MANPVLEWAPFRLAAGVTEADMLAAAAELQQGFIAKQPGFISRQLLQAADGTYVDLIWWRSREEAEQAMAHAGESAVCSAYFKVMAPAAPGTGADVALFEPLARYGGS